MKRKHYIFILTALITGAVILKFTTELWQPLVPQCVIYKNTGLYCPGCGGTRAVISLLNGHIIRALLYNPGAVVLVAVILLALAGKIADKKILPEKISFWAVLLGIIFIYYIMRNFTLFSAVLRQAY